MAMKNFPLNYSHIVKQLPFVLNRKSLFRLAFKNCYSDLLFQASETARKDPEIAQMIVHFKGTELEFLSDECKANRNVVLSAVGSNGSMIEFASEELRNDEEIILAAVKNGYVNFPESIFERYPQVAVECMVLYWNSRASELPEFIWTCRELVLSAIQRNVNIYSVKLLAPHLKLDREIVLIVALENITLLDEDLKNLDSFKDREFCLQFVKNNYLGFKFIPEIMRQDKEIMMACLRNDPSMIEFTELVKDKEFLLMALNEGCKILPYLPNDLLNEEEFLPFKESRFNLDDNFPMFMEEYDEIDNSRTKISLDESLFIQNDRSVILSAVRLNPSLLVFATEKLLNDSEFALQCVNGNALCIEYLPNFRTDKEFILQAIELKPDNICIGDLFSNDIDFKERLTNLILERRVAFSIVPPYLKENEDVLLTCMQIKQYDFWYNQIPTHLLDSKDFVLRAIKASPYTYWTLFSNDTNSEYEMLQLKYHGMYIFSNIKTRRF
ncbi:hypothetical protein NAEGRDRAFT_80504 [Naegleria gruberi]|uniref:DUF4116 domain-containing protein n=1 Tax=Naegleria gruberi TaxID=5762 RepID=D2VM35_NAEGR|nr:uncharacterized protein NAEGRDRAFT_80504 [Naegleria gruberi]EFC42160.1 hypothetical protein NAEGRDRAFT_80504 [Naegleria gruberi]|eukprot:XP_002674904.1 hypothetical protein NAEGRDRAFT_80504 [Naegleria gruberi strain NEG-M]